MKKNQIFVCLIVLLSVLLIGAKECQGSPTTGKGYYVPEYCNDFLSDVDQAMDEAEFDLAREFVRQAADQECASPELLVRAQELDDPELAREVEERIWANEDTVECSQFQEEVYQALEEQDPQGIMRSAQEAADMNCLSEDIIVQIDPFQFPEAYQFVVELFEERLTLANLKAPACGNGALEKGEVCDDGNKKNGDGCNEACVMDYGWYCPTAGKACKKTVCGDGVAQGYESCDDGNTKDGDGCSATCSTELGWNCPKGKKCIDNRHICGNGVIGGQETCDDGNLIPGDGCSATCQLEWGWKCPIPGSVCIFKCGDNYVDNDETCDDGNTVSGDGCSATCQQEYCGNSNIDPGETCDDGNNASGDGCSATCQTESGWDCSVPGSVCTPKMRPPSPGLSTDPCRYDKSATVRVDKGKTLFIDIINETYRYDNLTATNARFYDFKTKRTRNPAVKNVLGKKQVALQFNVAGGAIGYFNVAPTHAEYLCGACAWFNVGETKSLGLGKPYNVTLTWMNGVYHNITVDGSKQVDVEVLPGQHGKTPDGNDLIVQSSTYGQNVASAQICVIAD